jgi:hypothetical protein
MYPFRKLTVFLILLYSSAAAGQSFTIKDSFPQRLSSRVTDINPSVCKQHDTIWTYSGICKPLKVAFLTGNEADFLIDSLAAAARHSKLITVHGNIQYDFLYRSFADTPYYQKDFRQHTLQTSLDVLVKEKYPLRVNFIVRQSNSPYFKNFFDGGLQFDKQRYDRNIREQLANRIGRQLMRRPDLELAEAALQEELSRHALLKRQLESPDFAQYIIEEREKAWYRQQGMPDKKPAGSPASFDSTVTKLNKKLEDKARQLDSLQQVISGLYHYIDSVKNSISRASLLMRQQVYKAAGEQELKKIAAENGIAQEKGNKWETALSNIKSIGIGRSVLNYSELTVSNVSLTGINIEYNPQVYAAVAAGKIDYGFRDFFGRNTRNANQHLLLGRIGIGDKNKRAVILSFFTGKKMSYGGLLSDTVRRTFNVTGYSIEAIVKKDQYTYLSAEVAKSTKPVTGRYSDNKEPGSLFRWSDRTNLGISLKGQTIIPETKTRVSGFFRKTGENFQSFSLFTYNTDQTAWMLKADQSFLKERISLTGMLRRNDFINPFTEKTFKTSTVFTSVQAGVRVPKWPSLSIGYHPGSQLYIIDRERIRENVYYMLNGTLIHNYNLFGIRMVSSALYNRYASKGTDTGFIKYNGINYMFSQSMLFEKTQLQGNFMYTDQEELQFFTVEGNIDYSLANFLRLGAGIKYNKVVSGSAYWGARAQAIIEVKRIGEIQFQYEKSFLPTVQQTLFPVESGRVSWFKYF